MIGAVRVVFDWALDGPAWPGPLGKADFAFGEAWVGPMGLIDLLETRLGLGGRFELPLHRACRLATSILQQTGFWRESYDVDPLATCRRLLADRDQLRCWGWNGQPISSRLAELQAATVDASPGLPDRLEAVAQALSSRTSCIGSLVSHTVIAHLPALWRRVFAALQHSGVAVEELTPPSAQAAGDLQAARTDGFVPEGDGRLCLLRRHGPLEVADEVAASLAALDSLDDVVIIGADGVLDQALARHGLPRGGGHQGPPASSRLLDLVIATAFHPMRMSDLHALLAADPGPIPRYIAARLIDAIRDCPGRRTAQWRDALAGGLAELEVEKREDIERRVEALLMPVAGCGESVQVRELRTRLKGLDRWARARAAHVPSLVQLSNQIHTLLEAVDLMAASELSQHQLRRLCDDLGEPAWTWQSAQAGLAHVARPGAVLSSARAIVWWNFSRETAIRPYRLLLTRAEREGLRAAGAEPPEPSLAMAIEVSAWQRPLSLAQEAVVLACPLTDEDGQPNHPHPLWDDVVARLADHRDSWKLETRDVGHPGRAVTESVQAKGLPTPSPRVTLARSIALRDTESPSSLEKLLGCSLAWVLDYRADLRARISDGPASVGPLLFGSLSHRLLDQVLQRADVSHDEAAQLAGEMFDQQCADLCEDLGLPQHQAARATVRRAVVESARELLRLASKHEAHGFATEVPGQLDVAGQVVKGRLDLVWEQPAVVFDLKWGKSAHVERLKAGAAIQLAAYAAMQNAEGRAAESAYFVLQSQQVLSEPGGLLAADAIERGHHRASETWAATLATMQLRSQSLRAGQLEAPGATGDDVRAALSPDGVTVAPPCKYCRFAGLCGRMGVR